MSFFELVKKDFKIHDGFTVYRIRATQDFNNPYRNVKKGDLGGYVLYDHVLKSNSWIFGKAILINSILQDRSYIVGDHVYRGLEMINSHIIGTGDYYNEWDTTTLRNLSVVGQTVIQAKPKAVVWGTDTNTKETIVCVGCQNHSIKTWKNRYQSISNTHGFGSHNHTRYLGYLKLIEDSLKPSNEKVLEKISENVSKLKSQVTEELKSETVSLVTSLKVPEKILEKSGPQRDKFGRFAKKVP